MKLSKNLTIILAILLLAVLAVGAASASEDIAIDDGADSIDDVVSVSEDADDVVEVVDEVAPVEEEVADSEAVETEVLRTTTHQVTPNNWYSTNFEEEDAIFNFENGDYYGFNIKVGNYTTLNGNGAKLYGNHNTIIDLTNTSGVTITGFDIFVSDPTKNGIAGSFVYDASIYNNTIQDGDDGINIFRDWNNVSVYNNTIKSMRRDGISFANPTHTDLTTLNGAYIYNNTVFDSQFGIFVGGNFNGEIYNNNLYQLKIGMQFAGKPTGDDGKLIANLHDNNISAEVGIYMCHPGVLNFTLTGNKITGTNMSIDTNGSFSKTSDGGIYLYNNTINGNMSTDFINSITEAIGNDGTGAYNTPSINSRNLLGSAVEEIIDGADDSNAFINGDFSDELNGWNVEGYQANPFFNNAPLQYIGVTADPQVASGDENHGNYININSSMSNAIYLFTQNIDLTDVDHISFDYKYFIGSTYTHYYGLIIDNARSLLAMDSNETIGDGEWHTYTIPKAVFSEYDGLHNVSLAFLVQASAGITNGDLQYVDNIIAFKNAAVPTYTADDLQNLINDAAEGGVIDLVAGAIYDVGSTQFTLTKKVTINGNGATIIASGAAQGGQGAVIIAKAAGSTFKDIIFKNSDGHKEYGEGVAGYAIELAIENGTVDNCMFLDWSSGIYGRGAAFCTIMNSYFNGSSDLVTGAGKGEVGTKAINLMGSHDITVKGCTFEGQVLDGISIASNSGHNIMTDNTFIDNVYAIYFGGASTQGCVIANNTFIRCGYCPNVTDEINKKVTILSTQKACNGFIIADNVIEALSGTTFISMESGNTAHGYPSTIGDINVTGNTLALAEGAVAQTVTFVKIVSNQGELSPYAPINISGNDLADGVTPVKVWYADWGSEDNPTIPAADPVVTSFEIVDVSTANKKLTVKLVDIGGEALAGETISYSINGAAAKTAETDEDGLVTIDVTENGVVAIAFEGNDNYQAAETSINFAATAQRTTPTITASAMSAYAKIGKYYTVTLKDASGNAIVGQTVKFIFNGKTTNVKTDENGKAKLNINVASKGTYQITVSFLGNDKYNAVVAVKNIKVAVQKTKATFAKKTFKVKKAKKLSFTLKDSKGKAIAGKKITFKVNKKTYTAKTNKKGIATVKVKLTKKGKYTATAKFAGDNTYKKISKKAKITVK